MQPYIDTYDRDFRMTPDGDLMMTNDQSLQNATGQVRIQLGSNMFHNEQGIDWAFYSTLGDHIDIKRVIEQDITQQFVEQKLSVQSCEVKTFTSDGVEAEIRFTDDTNQTINFQL